MQRQGFAEDLLVGSGLVVAREHKPGVYDRFRNRLMFPIHDRLGRPVAFGGRYLDKAEALHLPTQRLPCLGSPSGRIEAVLHPPSSCDKFLSSVPLA